MLFITDICYAATLLLSPDYYAARGRHGFAVIFFRHIRYYTILPRPPVAADALRFFIAFAIYAFHVITIKIRHIADISASFATLRFHCRHFLPFEPLRLPLLILLLMLCCHAIDISYAIVYTRC